MALQQGTVPRWFAIDSDTDITGDTVEFSLDEQTWFAGAWDPSPPVHVLSAGDASNGLTRYWATISTGPGGSLPMVRGNQVVYGRVTDAPSVPHFGWKVRVARTE